MSTLANAEVEKYSSQKVRNNSEPKNYQENPEITTKKPIDRKKVNSCGNTKKSYAKPVRVLFEREVMTDDVEEYTKVAGLLTLSCVLILVTH